MKYQIGGHTVLLYKGALDVMRRYVQNQTYLPESGGILLGKLIDDEIHLTKASVPTQLDVGTRYTFERNKLSAQIIIDYEFYNSGGQTVYLGEWHTHPENTPTPSSVDRKMMSQQFNDSKGLKELVLLIIVGISDIYLGAYNGKDLVKAIKISL